MFGAMSGACSSEKRIYSPVGAQNFIVFDGNSLTLGTGSTANNDYPSQCLALLGPGWRGVNYGVFGQTTGSMTADAATQIDTQYNAYLKVFIVAWEGAADILAGQNAAGAYAHLITYYQGRFAAGFTRGVVCTVLPNPTGGFEATRQSLNTLLRNGIAADFPGWVLADVAGDARIGANNANLDTTYYDADTIHLNNTGYAIVAPLVKTAILSVA